MRSLLLALPLELRNKIYRLLYESIEKERCISPDIYRTRHRLDFPSGQVKKPTATMALRANGSGLLRTCKQVHEEATIVLYGINVFHFTENLHPLPTNAFANADMESPRHELLLGRISLFGGMSDLLQMKDFYDMIGASNRAKMRHVRIQLNVDSRFIEHAPSPCAYADFSLTGKGANVLCDALDMIAMAGGKLDTLEFTRDRSMVQNANTQGTMRVGDYTIMSPVRLYSNNHTKLYPSYKMFEAGGDHGVDAPLARSIRGLGGTTLICKDIDFWKLGRCDKGGDCSVCIQIKGFELMKEEMHMTSAGTSKLSSKSYIHWTNCSLEEMNRLSI